MTFVKHARLKLEVNVLSTKLQSLDLKFIKLYLFFEEMKVLGKIPLSIISQCIDYC